MNNDNFSTKVKDNKDLIDYSLGGSLVNDMAHLKSNNDKANSVSKEYRLPSAIYDLQGNFLGTDDEGLQGEAIVMDKDDFTQGMSHKDALDKGTLGGDLPMVYSQELLNEIDGHYNGLSSRPDWDGHLIFSEVTKWSNQGKGEPLFVNVTKINLNAINVLKLKQDEDGFINFFPVSHPNTGMVYGTIKINLLDENTGYVN